LIRRISPTHPRARAGRLAFARQSPTRRYLFPFRSIHIMSGTPYSNGTDPKAGTDTARTEPLEGIGPNASTREGAAQPVDNGREAPMPDRPIGKTAVRGGVTLGHMRWVLGASLLLVIVAMALAFILS
jgi:hypothetical protein